MRQAVRPDERDPRISHVYPPILMDSLGRAPAHIFRGQECWCKPKVEFDSMNERVDRPPQIRIMHGDTDG